MVIFVGSYPHGRTDQNVPKPRPAEVHRTDALDGMGMPDS